jgi:HlyD family secretion protein
VKIALTVLLVLLGLLIVVAVVAGPRLQELASSLAPTPQKTKVRLETVKSETIAESVKAPGRIEPHTKVDISAEVSARIVDLPFRQGERVAKGDVIVRLDDRDYRAALEATMARRDGEMFRLQSEEARLAGLMSSLSFARKELDRKQTLHGTGDVSAKDLDDARERVQDLESSVEASTFSISVIESSLAAAKADIVQAEKALSKTTITAPMDGLVTKLNAEVGENVLGMVSNTGMVIMTIADLSRMVMKSEIAESDISKVAEGQPARIHINAFRDKVFSGVVTQVALQRTEPGMGQVSSSSSTGYFECEIEIDLRGELVRSGSLANVDIETATHTGLTVESQAVLDRVIEDLPDDIRRDSPLIDFSKKTTSVVFRMVQDKAVCTPVKRGASDDTRSIILEGLHEGDRVVIGPFKALEKLKHDESLEDESLVKPDAKDGAEKAIAASGDSQPAVKVEVSP